MEKTTCPGCGAPWNGKHCRSCGYKLFLEEPHPKRSASASRERPAGKARKHRKKHPIIRFLLLLCLIYALMPTLRNWGLKLEETEENNRSVTQEAVIPDADLVTLYSDEELHIFTTEYDARHLSEGLTLYIQNDTNRDLTFHMDELLINGSTAGQALYCKANAGSTGKNWLRFDPGTGTSEIRSVSFRLQALDASGSQLMTTDRIILGEAAETAEPFS